MTLKERSQLCYLQREIAMDERRLEELEAKLRPGGMKFSGMPQGAGAADKVGLYAAEIVESDCLCHDLMFLWVSIKIITSLI